MNELLLIKWCVKKLCKIMECATVYDVIALSGNYYIIEQSTQHKTVRDVRKAQKTVYNYHRMKDNAGKNIHIHFQRDNSKTIWYLPCRSQ